MPGIGIGISVSEGEWLQAGVTYRLRLHAGGALKLHGGGYLELHTLFSALVGQFSFNLPQYSGEFVTIF